MKSAYENICRLLASSGFSEREIFDFSDELFNIGPNGFLDDITHLKRLSKNTLIRNAFDVSPNQPRPTTNDTVKKIERLLIDEARLLKIVAVAMLSSELLTRFPKIQLPVESRKGFNHWLHKLTELVPEKELLHLATKIRNRSVHDQPTDWRLK